MTTDSEDAAAWPFADQLVSASGEAILAVDVDGIIRFWNGGCEDLFGWPPSEAGGRSLDLIIPERFRLRHWRGFERAMAAGRSRYGRGERMSVPALHRDGRWMSIEFTITVLRDDQDRPFGMAAIIRDETARYHRTRGMENRIRILERALSGQYG